MEVSGSPSPVLVSTENMDVLSWLPVAGHNLPLAASTSFLLLVVLHEYSQVSVMGLGLSWLWLVYSIPWASSLEQQASERAVVTGQAGDDKAPRLP